MGDTADYCDYLHKVIDGVFRCPSCPDFETDLSWINVDEPLSIFGNLKGKIVILDFWTYCCINCLHILPDLHELEGKYRVQDGVVVIGVHSAKFPNEKNLENLQNAVQRYGITHPVVNDINGSLWSKLEIQCWPTIAVISPDGKVLKTFIGEGHKEELFNFIGCVLYAYKFMVSKEELNFQIGAHSIKKYLCFPGKVAVSNNKLYISDTGNKRVLVTTLGGEVIKVIKNEPDKKIFKSVQGLTVVEDCLYVTDCDGHQIVKVNLNDNSVSVIAGTGYLGTDKTGGNTGNQQIISSPWDVKPYNSTHGISSDYDMLLIAMAGTHQIWSYFLKDVVWWKGRNYTAGTACAIVGSGNEENRNNSYPLKCGLAQPSGLSIDYKNKICYVADSESSTIRQLYLTDGQVKGLIGGSRDPMDLFAYGDADGKGPDVKLQHPLDVCVITDTDFVVVCDSYNHKLKLVNCKDKVATTLPVQSLNEPSGLCYDDKSRTLYVADTNNHRIVKIVFPENLDDINTLSTSEVDVHEPDEADSPTKPLFDHTSPSVKKLELGALSVPRTNHTVTVNLLKLPEDSHLTPDIQSVWRAVLSSNANGNSQVLRSESGPIHAVEGDEMVLVAEISIKDLNVGCQYDLDIEVIYYYCSSGDKVCRRSCALLHYLIHCV